MASNPIVELKQFNESFFITINGETLYERGIVDKRFATLNSGDMRCSLFIDSIREAGFGWIEDQTKAG